MCKQDVVSDFSGLAYTADASALTASHDCRVLLLYVQPGEVFEGVPLHWAPPQLSTLRYAALAALLTVAPTFPQVSLSCHWYDMNDHRLLLTHHEEGQRHVVND